MAITDKSISIRMHYYTKPELPAVEAFAKAAMKNAEPMTWPIETGVKGWVTTRFMLDGDIKEESVMRNGYLVIDHMRGGRKINAEYLRSEIRMECQAEMATRGVDFLKRADIQKISKEVKQRLAEYATPFMKATTLVIDAKSGFAVSTAVSVGSLDELDVSAGLIGVTAPVMNPYTAARMLRKIDAAKIDATSFTPKVENRDGMVDSIGQDFLIYIWWVSTESTFSVMVENLMNAYIYIDGPLVFTGDVHDEGGADAKKAAISQGKPTISPEAFAALMSGKKLKSCKVVIAAPIMKFEATVDADEWTFKSLRFDESGEAAPMSPEERFEHRMTQLNAFRQYWLRAYDSFIELRAGSDWERVRNKIEQWVTDRAGK
jgi:hypothetical protein